MDYRQQLERLWQYQLVDLEIDKTENVLRTSQLRQRLARSVAYLKEQQASIARMEAEAQEVQNKLEIVARECVQSTQEYDVAQQIELEQMTREQLNTLRQQSAQWADVMARRERELTALSEQLRAQMKQLEEMRVGVARAKKEYPALKSKYDEEAEKLAQQTQPLRQKRDEMGEQIDAELLARYKNIKGRRPNPVAKVVADQCAGCNMQIAQFVLSRAKATGGVVECENCGRILYLVD